MWVDEIEQGLGGSGGASTDGGTTQRVFGALLTWLQEKTAPVFVVATANRIAQLPPELLRKGRFDEIFFVGLPSVEERRAIAKIHLERRGRDGINYKAIAEATDGFSGAEIEQAVIEGLFSAFSAGRELTLADVTTAAKATSPLSKTMGEEIKQLESWAQGRARPASKTTTTKTSKRRRRGPALGNN
jgi:SpoVK/Ycf46/Vps4 family AAA+-type ATPase